MSAATPTAQAVRRRGPVVVSPHLDDAVLSAAVQLLRPGAVVVTVFAGRPPEGTPPAWWDVLTGATDARTRVGERWLEDDAAMACLGVGRSVRLDFADHQHRTDDRARPAPDDLVAALRPHLAGVAEVWVPAAIGCHPDHLAARDAALAAADPGAARHHYADVPYSVRYGWPASVTGAPRAAYLDVDHWLSGELVDAGLKVTELTRTVHVLDEDQRRLKADAMACYATQIPALDYGRVLADGDPAVVGFEVSWSQS